MGIEEGAFEVIVPSRYISFTVPNLLSSNFTDYLDAKNLQISILDSPTPPSPPHRASQVAAMLVPRNRENDWIFTTEAGHLQLLLSAPGISRLILIGNAPNCDDDSCYLGKTYYAAAVVKDQTYMEKLEGILHPLLIAFVPKEIAKSGISEIPFLRYEDNVISGVILEVCVGSCVGEMLVEDVEIEDGPRREFRRRLRFKRMPNLVQTQIRVVPSRCSGSGSDCLQIGEVDLLPDLGVLVHPYLAPMVASLSLISGFLQEKFQSMTRPRVMCIGVGGGSLLAFMGTQLGFEVVGVEVDEVVLSVARRHFGLQSGGFIQVYVGDGIEILNDLACLGKIENNPGSSVAHDVASDSYMDNVDVFSSKFDVIMVDLDSTDCRMCICAPALEFMHKNVLLAAKSSLSEVGILVVNVMSLSRPLRDTFVCKLDEVFEELYEIDAGNGENYVFIATRSPVVPPPGDTENPFLTQLRLVISGAFIDSIRKI
ncbi:hypothetical protein Nepgr_001301 [Nepenthes gracilis]|uniref:Methyltransferase-like protein 13 n=1 Tax=Nepenthes gracilis TaxID=150966 RepID=A0AAD3RW02_NEPGR|nr:hypothetical protein Nepgr_001301 [Nepenthes gracilis]